MAIQMLSKGGGEEEELNQLRHECWENLDDDMSLDVFLRMILVQVFDGMPVDFECLPDEVLYAILVSFSNNDTRIFYLFAQQYRHELATASDHDEYFCAVSGY